MEGKTDKIVHYTICYWTSCYLIFSKLALILGPISYMSMQDRGSAQPERHDFDCDSRVGDERVHFATVALLEEGLPAHVEASRQDVSCTT